jgi:hypothetical protein
MNKLGVDYGNDVDVEHNIPNKWWLEHDACKYLLSCLVHMENKDISTKPTQLVAGQTRENICEKRREEIEAARAVAHAERPEKSGESEMKKMRMDGMQSQVDINKVTRITNQINLMEIMKEMYVRSMGIEKYEEKVVALINKMPDMADAPVDLLGMPTSTTELSKLPIDT